MNYFGHAAVAAHHFPQPAFVLGAMLPDLAAMTRAALPEISDSVVRDGLAFHVLTDSVFHQTSRFVFHNQRVLSVLRTLGIARGPARACAHIGVEMLIDAKLAKTDDYLEAYCSALRFGAKQWAGLTVAGRPDEASKVKLEGLLLLLAERGAAVFDATFERFRDRLGGALAHRPRLAPSEPELEKIARYLANDTQVGADVDELMQELVEQLRNLSQDVAGAPSLVHG